MRATFKISIGLLTLDLLDTNRTRLVRKAHPTESFFNFFSPPVAPSEEAIEAGEIGEDELDDLEEKLEIDYQIGEDIKEKVHPTGTILFACLSPSSLLRRSSRVLLTISPARQSNTTCSLKMRRITTMKMMTRTMTMTTLMGWYGSSRTFFYFLADKLRG